MIGDAAVIASIVLLWLLVVVEGLLILGLARQVGTLQGPGVSTSPSVTLAALAAGSQAPDFVLTDSDGAPVELSDYAGAPLLLIAAGESCGSCARLVPALNRLVEQSAVAVLVAISTDVAGAAAWKDQHGLAARLAADPSGVFASSYSVRARPFAFAIDAEGVVRHSGHTPDEDALMAILREGLGDDAVAIPAIVALG